MSKKTVLRFSTKELHKLVNNTHAHVKLITSSRKLSLHPNCLNDVKTSVHEVLDARLAKFDYELKGILLSYKNVKILKNLAKVLHDDPYLYATVRADFYVFVPEVGCTLFGIVNKKSPDHLGCLVHKVFNVALPRPESDTGEEWQGFYIEPGQAVTFTVEYIDLTGSLPYMRGRLSDIGKIPKFEENSIGDLGKANDSEDNEERKLSTSQDIKDLMDSAATHFLVDKKPKKKKVKKEIKEESNSDSDHLSLSQSFILDEREKKSKSKKKTKGCNNNSLSNEFELLDYVYQQDLVSCKAKEKGSKKRKLYDYKCPLTDFENTHKTIPNVIEPENSSNNKIKKKKHRDIIKKEAAAINDATVQHSEMEEGSDGEVQNIAPPKILEPAENFVPKTKKKKKKKKDDAILEADESILTTENLVMTASLKPKEGVSLKRSTKLNSILSEDLKDVATSTPKEQKIFQKFSSNLSEIKRGSGIDEVETPKILKLSKKQKIKKIDINEMDFSNLKNTNVDDYNEVKKVKPINKERTKETNDSNGSLSSSSSSPGKQKLIKSKEQKKSGSMSETCNLLLENMLSKFSSTMQVPNCDTIKEEPDTPLNVKPPKKRNLPLSKTIERDEECSSDFTSHSSENEIEECFGTKNSKILHDSNGSMQKLKKHKSKTEIVNTPNSPINKLNERSPRKTKNKNNKTRNLSVGNYIETKPSSSHSENSPKKNKNHVCSIKEEVSDEFDDEANKVKQTKKNDVISWELPDSLMEIQKTILEKLKSEMSPVNEKKLKSEISPAKDKKLKSELSPVKDKKSKSELSPAKNKKSKSELPPAKDKKSKSELSPAKDKKLKSKLSPVKDKKLKRKRHSDDGIRDNIVEKSSITKVAKLESADYKLSEDVTDFKVSKGKSQIVDRLKIKEANERVAKVTDSPIKEQGIRNKISNSSKSSKEDEKLGSTIENEKEKLLHKMLNSISAVIKLEVGGDMKLNSKETKKERNRLKQVTGVQINDKNNMLIQSSDVPMQNLFFQQKYDDENYITQQDEKYEVTRKKQENKKKKKKDKDKLSFCEGDGNVSGDISNEIGGDISGGDIVNKLVSEVSKKVNSKKAKQKEQTALTSSDDNNETTIKINTRGKLNGKGGEIIGVDNTMFENTKIHKQLNIGELDTKISYVEKLKKASHIAPAGHNQEKVKKVKTKRNVDKDGLAENKEPDHRKKEKRHSAISQQEEESPTALAERLLQEFIQQKKCKIFKVN